MPDGTKLFRQEAPDTAEHVNKLELYLFYLPSPEQLCGWWIAEAFSTTQAELDGTKAYAWAPMHEQTLLPEASRIKSKSD